MKFVEPFWAGVWVWASQLINGRGSGSCSGSGSGNGRCRSRGGGGHGRGHASGNIGKRDSMHHPLLETVSETASVLELRQRLLYTTPYGWWWWCIELVLRNIYSDDGSV